MVHKNTGWSVESVDVECTSGDSESWDAIITYRHTDGRWVQENYTFILCGEVLVDGERHGWEPFLSNVDDNYTEAMEAYGDTQAVERRYSFMANYETRYAGHEWGHEEEADWADPVESGPYADSDLDTYDGPADSRELDRSVEAHLEEWASNWGQSGLRFNDLDDMHKLLTED